MSIEANIVDLSKRASGLLHVKNLLEEGFESSISEAVDFSRKLLEHGIVQILMDSLDPVEGSGLQIFLKVLKKSLKDF